MMALSQWVVHLTAKDTSGQSTPLTTTTSVGASRREKELREEIESVPKQKNVPKRENLKNVPKSENEMVTTNDDVGKCTVREMRCYTMDCSPDVTEKRGFHIEAFLSNSSKEENGGAHVTTSALIYRCVLGIDCHLP